MRTIAELLRAAEEQGSISRAAIAWQAAHARSEDAVACRMRDSWQVMKESVRRGLSPELRSPSGCVGGQAARLQADAGVERFGALFGRACAYAMAVAESNACMGKIVAAPTAGSCGVLPSVLLAAQEQQGFSDKQIVDALFTAAAFGRVIAVQATLAGAEGGCQAECGAAAGMAAAALTELYGGTPAQSADACAFALMNLLGLVCDPVHGLVEIPCVYRNVGAASQALAAAQMALCGIRCPIPCDEMIQAMKDVGDTMPPSLRETGEGGCAACPTFCR